MNGTSQFREKNQNYTTVSNVNGLLKVPKCEIFDLFDFNDFYVIKSLQVGDFRDKIKNKFFCTDGLDMGLFIFVSVCAVYADNDF